MDLNKFTITQLEQELERRKKIKRPKPIDKPNLEMLTLVCSKQLNNWDNNIEDDNLKQEIYEVAMETIFGNSVFNEYINTLKTDIIK